MENAINQQFMRKKLIESFITNFKKDGAARRTVKYYERRLKTFQQLWEKFEDGHKKLMVQQMSEKEESEHNYFKENTYDVVQSYYWDNYDVIEQKFEDDHPTKSQEVHDQNSTTKVNSECNIKLPKIALEKFNGDYNMWPSFHDLYNSLVHKNNSLSNVQKLQYLKLHLEGEPEHLLRYFQVTDSNYSAAWEVLINRYENKRMLVNNQLKNLFNLQPLHQESSWGIKKLLDTTKESLLTLQNLKIEVSSWDPIIIYLVVQNFPNQTHQLWEQRIGNNRDLPSWNELEDFLQTRFRTLEAIAGKNLNFKENRWANQHNNKKSAQTFHITSNMECPACTGQHIIRKCPKFLSSTVAERLEVAKSRGLCLNCLNNGHFLTNCTSHNTCMICRRRHHTLLHKTSNDRVSSISNENRENIQNRNEPSTSRMVHNVSVNKTYNKQILLATARVKVKSRSSGRETILRALIDQGSQGSFITEFAVQTLGLQKESIDMSIQGIGKNEIARSTARVNLIITPLQGETRIETEGFVMKSLTNIMPTQKLHNTKWKHIQGLRLADPEYHTPGKIDLLLGADVYSKIILPGLKRNDEGGPIAQQTIFGWILSGGIQDEVEAHNIMGNFHIMTELNNNIKRFWELEEINMKPVLNEEEERCEQHFNRTHIRLSNGKYMVELPLKENMEEMKLGRSKNIAFARLKSLEQQFRKNKEFAERYKKCIAEYLELDHMEEVNTQEENFKGASKNGEDFTCCYLPHHGVIKESSTTTKLRVVFDASRPTTSGVSLNDKMLKGPIVQEELVQILMRWRKHKIAFTADIEKMYRQIMVTPSHAEYQRILWRKNEEDPIKTYKLSTVTFGTKSAPYIATKVLKQLAIDEQKNYPLGSAIALQDFYVDDLLSGADNITIAKEIQSQIIELTKKGGFLLRKWSSNSDDLLQNIPKDYCEIKFPLSLNAEESIKTLGIIWFPEADQFSYSLHTIEEEPLKWTKRSILSEIAKIFDPLGWLAPIIIKAKIFIQKLWLTGLNWDDEVDSDIISEWQRYRTNFKDVTSIHINRWLSYTNDAHAIEIHGFSDASIQAYAAVVYMCVIDKSGTRHISLIAAKSKVAPVKTVSLPRLELCGAVLLSKLLTYVTTSLNINHPYSTRAWTDSEIVLSWLKGHPSRWTTFVANRVSEIHQTIGNIIWSYVASKDNPADCASRGVYPMELKTNSLWWNGPEWLSKADEFWPKNKNLSNTELEKRKRVTCLQNLISHQEKTDTFWEELENKFSSLTKLIRVTAYILRFINNIKRKSVSKNNYLSTKEFQEALNVWIKQTQQKNFKDEITSLQNNKLINNKSKLIKLNPFLDDENILRVGGRLSHADLLYNTKHPIIIPTQSKLAHLIIAKSHQETIHGGPQLMMNIIMQKFWIFNLRNLTRHFVHKCVRCYRQQASTQTQLMADLPKARVTKHRPFSHSGIDYCGPFELKTYKGKNPKRYKAYIALFVCMAVKAIHLEVVTDMSAEGFIAAYRRFSSRRGKCESIYCDCGTNFTAANKILIQQHKQLIRSLNKEIKAVFENEGVNFNFIPPGSPHFGGLWEAGVRSTKNHLKRILNTTTLTYEEFITVITQIEACLNSRPLTEISNDPQDYTPLTPSHFLIGDFLLDIKLNRLDKWQNIQRLYQLFWKRWSSEYLNRLQQRPKWTIKQKNLQVGELVIIKDERLPPNRWLLGRIVETHPGIDGLVRVVTIKTKENILKRSIAKICRLPIENSDDNTQINED